MAVKILSSVAHSGHSQCGLPLTSANGGLHDQVAGQSGASRDLLVMRYQIPWYHLTLHSYKAAAACWSGFLARGWPRLAVYFTSLQHKEREWHAAPCCILGTMSSVSECLTFTQIWVRATGVVSCKRWTLISLLWVCEVCQHVWVADSDWPGALKRNTQWTIFIPGFYTINTK